MNAALSDHSNYVLRVLELFAEYGDREALLRGDQRFTYTELRTAVMNMASTMHEHGVRPGMTVVVLLDRPIEAPVVQLALHALSTRSVWIDVNAVRRDLGEYMRIASPDLLLYDPRTRAEQGRQLTEQLGVPAVCLGPGGIGPDVLAAPTTAFDPAWAAGSPESVFQTSGTTGAPKLVVHRESFYRQTVALGEELVASGEHRLRHLSFGGLAYLAGQIQALLYLFAGGTLVLLGGFELKAFLGTIERERVQSIFVAPPMLSALLDSPILDETDVSSLEMLSVGAAPATTHRLRQAVRRFGPIVRITYGLSECTFISAFPEIGADQSRPELLRSCGQPYGDVQVQIRAEDGTVLGQGDTGELWVSSKLNFAGYLGQPELTAQTLVDGWVRTRDLGYLDTDGYLYLVGRADDMIIVGAACGKIFPRPIEDTLTAHPQVRAAAVIGVPGAEFNQAAHAYVVRSDGATVTETELAELIGGELAAWWIPGSFEFVESLPLTAIGKVHTSALRAKYAAEHGIDSRVGGT